MTHPNTKQTIAKLQDWQENHATIAKLMDGVKTCIGLDPSGPMFESVWRLFEAYTAALSAELGDHSKSWLSWYYMENDMGRKGFNAGYDGKTKPIKTLAHLAQLIAQARKRGQA